ILAADLSSFVLDLAHWGVTDTDPLAFLDPPPKPALSEARALLRELDALDSAGRITGEGKKLRALPLPPRLARMVVDAAAEGSGGGFVLANGRGAIIDPASSLAREPFLAIGEIAGSATQARVILAAPITQAEIETRFGEHIETRDQVVFDVGSLSLRGRAGKR